jgi:DNA-binding NtrC family response regulator
MNHTAQVLLISDDQSGGSHYRGALEAAGYGVMQIESFDQLFALPPSNHDIVVLNELAVVAYPGQHAPVLRIPHNMTPDELVGAVHRKVSLRAALMSSAGV